jgi:hypothetical protein
MGALFRFFLYLFICFVAAKFLLQAFGVESRQYLVGLTAVLLANVYWLSHLAFRDRGGKEILAPERQGRKRPKEEPEAGEPPAGASSEKP